MPHLNVEIKARCNDHKAIRDRLVSWKADFKGTDRQVDTYFKVAVGRLKLREDTLENNLIYYSREDAAGPKQSYVTLCKTEPDSPLKSMLLKAVGALATVDKQREIYFLDNVKFHLDTIEGLGTFMEIEAIDYEGTIGKEKLREQCQHYLDEFGVRDEDLLTGSYSDMVIEGQVG